MPQCQFLFSAVFGFRKVVQEIFSESDEIKCNVPILLEDTGSQKGSSGRPRGWPDGVALRFRLDRSDSVQDTGVCSGNGGRDRDRIGVEPARHFDPDSTPVTNTPRRMVS